jgi:acyl dehydratase
MPEEERPHRFVAIDNRPEPAVDQSRPRKKVRCTTRRTRSGTPPSAARHRRSGRPPSVFESRIAHGGLIIGAISEVGAEDLPGPGGVFLNVNWRFIAPVYVPDEVTSHIEVLEVRHDKPIARLKTIVTRSDGQVVLEGEAMTYTSPRKSLQNRADHRLP